MVLDIIKDRCCVRNFSQKKIPQETIKTIVEAGQLAPSWMNVQPWHFLAVSDTEMKEFLVELSFNQQHVKKADTLILCLADIEAWNDKNFGKILAQKGLATESIEFILKNPLYNPKQADNSILILRCVEQCTYAMAYMTLQAHSLGVGACIIGALNNDINCFDLNKLHVLKEKLNIPQGYLLIGMLALGYKADDFECPKKIRKDFNEIVSFEKFGNVN